jgi:hypothetical protein
MSRFTGFYGLTQLNVKREPMLYYPNEEYLINGNPEATLISFRKASQKLHISLSVPVRFQDL